MLRITVILMTSLLLLVGCDSYNNEGVRLNEHGVVAYEAEHYTEALKFFSEALEEETIPTYSINQGMVLIALGDYESAYNSFQKALEEGSDIEAYYGSGLALLYLGEVKEAINYFNQVLELDETNVLAYRNRGLSYLALNDLEKAYEDLKHAKALDQEDRQLDLDLASYYEKSGESKKALEIYAYVIEEDESLAGEAYYLRGCYYLELGEQELGIKDLEEASKRDKVLAYLRLGDYYVREGNLDKGFKNYESYLKDQPSVSGYNRLGVLAYEARKYEEALNYFLRAQMLEPFQVEVLFNISRTYISLGNYKEAKDYIVKILDQRPQDEMALKELAYIESRLIQP